MYVFFFKSRYNVHFAFSHIHFYCHSRSDKNWETNNCSTYVVLYLTKKMESMKFGQIGEYKIRDTRGTNLFLFFKKAL